MNKFFVKIENGIVTQKQPYKSKGFIEADPDVVCGMMYDGENYTIPEKKQSAMEKWLGEISDTSKYLTHFEEQIMDALGVDKFDTYQQKKHAATKAKIAQKPTKKGR